MINDPGPARAAAQSTDASLADRVAAIGERLQNRGFIESSRLTAKVWTRPAPARALVVLSRQSRTRYAGEIRYRKHLGYRLRIDLDCNAPTRFYVVKRTLARSRLLRRIWRWRQLELIESTPASLREHVVLARERAWTSTLLLNPEADDAIAELTTRHAGRLNGSVILEPGVLTYASPILTRDAVTASYVEDMLDGLETIATTCEQLPRPDHPLQPSRLQALTRKHPLAAPLAVIAGLFGCALVLGLIFAAGLAAVAIYQSS